MENHLSGLKWSIILLDAWKIRSVSLKYRDRYDQKMTLKHSNKHLTTLPNNITHVFLLVHLNLENFPLDSFDEYAFKNYLFFRVYIFLNNILL